MCSIFGAIVTPHTNASETLTEVWEASAERGRDSCGVHHCTHSGNRRQATIGSELKVDFRGAGVYIGNRRAEPTTEWVGEKSDSDIQPFVTPGGWHMAHNGTIANDRDVIEKLRGSRGFFEPRTSIDTEAFGIALDVVSESQEPAQAFRDAIAMMEGSFALLAAHTSQPDRIFYAANYKPLYVQSVERGGAIVLASQRHYLPDNGIFQPAPTVIPPYTWGWVSAADGLNVVGSLYSNKGNRTLVVCSGGLDSTVAATFCKNRGDDVTLLHFLYGCKAEGKELEAVHQLSAALDVPLETLTTSFFKESATSSLTDDARDIVTGFGGAAGAEYGHEWVPARNTVLIALAVAYAEAHGFDTIVLGNNLEESGGGYPDNEQEFINRWRDLIPYAVKPYTRIDFEQPLGSLMKHEIVALGSKLNAPFESSWSCYYGGDQHCGTCGPCFMRKTAFRMNGLTDPVMPKE